MRRAQPAAVKIAETTEELVRALDQDTLRQELRHPTPTPLPKPSPADRIREALQRWLEEDM
jgi:hypothetical protein